MENFDLKMFNAKKQLTDAVTLPQRITALQAPPKQQQQPPVRAQFGPITQQVPAGAPNPGQQFGGWSPGMQQQQPMATQVTGFQGGVQAPLGPGTVGANVNMDQRGNIQGGNANMNMPAGNGQFDINAALDNAFKLQNLQARYNQGPFSAGANYAPGQGMGGDVSYNQGPFSASANYAPGQGMGGEVGYNQGPFSANMGYDQNRGAYGNVGFRQTFQEGGLATSIRTNPADRQRDMDFINTRNQHMREVVGRAAYAKGGGVWTRKEGQNPEGGLNAKGRASLRAQGHDIKPPVSAKQAKKSPKAAARRSSFCARMSGMPGPMKDEKGRPTRKALSLRKWDC